MSEIENMANILAELPRNDDGEFRRLLDTALMYYRKSTMFKLEERVAAITTLFVDSLRVNNYEQEKLCRQVAKLFVAYLLDNEKNMGGEKWLLFKDALCGLLMFRVKNI